MLLPARFREVSKAEQKLPVTPLWCVINTQILITIGLYGLASFYGIGLDRLLEEEDELGDL